MLSADANTLAVKMVELLTHAHLAPTRPRLRIEFRIFRKCWLRPSSYPRQEDFHFWPQMELTKA